MPRDVSRSNHGAEAGAEAAQSMHSETEGAALGASARVQQVWKGKGVTAKEIVVALEDLGRQERRGPRHQGEEDTSATDRRMRQVLASSLTLVGFVPDTEGLREAEAAIRALPQRRPARVILVVPDADASPEGVDCLVRAEMGGHEGSTQVRHEQVTLRVRRMASRHLANLVSTLVVPQLPVYGWMLGTFPFGRTWQGDWEDILDRLLVDTGSAYHPLDAVLALGDLTRGLARFGLGDLAYTRLRPWQEALAEVFDAPLRREFLGRMDRIEVHGPVQPFAPDEPSSGSLLLAGWLASRLGWGAARAGGPEHVVFERPGGDVRLTYRPDGDIDGPSPFRGSGVTSVRLMVSEGGEEGRMPRVSGAAGFAGLTVRADRFGRLTWEELEGGAGGQIPVSALDTAHALYACVERIGDRIFRPTVERASDVARALLRARAIGGGEDDEAEEEGKAGSDWEETRPTGRKGVSR